MNDIFISYAHVDNESLTEGQKGWISQFHRTLEIRLRQLLGENPNIWRDQKLSGTDIFDEKIIKTEMATDSLQWTDVWDTFRSWMGRSYGWDNLPKRLEARKKLEGEKCFNQKLHKGAWTGFLLPRQCTSQSF